MTKGDLLSLIQASAKDDSRSLSARVREHLDDIEAALAAGFKRAVIVDALSQKGIVVTVKQLEQILYRERRKNAEEKQKAKQHYSGTGAANPSVTAAKINAPETPAQHQQPAAETTADAPKKSAAGISGTALFGERPAPGLRPANLEIDQDGDQK